MAHRNISRMAEKKLLVLVDLDQTIADFEGHFLKKYQEKHPGEPFIPLEDRTTFYVADQYDTLGEGYSVWQICIIVIKFSYWLLHSWQEVPNSNPSMQHDSFTLHKKKINLQLLIISPGFLLLSTLCTLNITWNFQIIECSSEISY